MSLTRPGTLVQVLQLVDNGEKAGFCLSNFLDEFYWDASKTSRARSAKLEQEGMLAMSP